MIWVSFLSLVFAVFNIIFYILPDLPQVPESFTTAINNFFDLIFGNSGLVSFFLPMSLVKIALPIVIILVNFKYIYHVVMWLVRKLPWSID